MASEFEEYRTKRIKQDFIDILTTELDENDYICEECDSPIFKLNSDDGLCCAVCGAAIDLTQIEV